MKPEPDYNQPYDEDNGCYPQSKRRRVRTLVQRLVRPLEAGAVVRLRDGSSQTISRVNKMDEAEGLDPFYRWDPYDGEIEHAAMDPDKHSIVSVDWPND